MFLLNIIIPVFNEGENIRKTLSEIKEKIHHKNVKISIVYDFVEDNTVPIVKDIIEKDSLTNVILLKNKYGKGVLNAIKTGFESITEGAALVIMADLSDDLIVVDSMINMFVSGYDIVCGSRYMKGGQQKGGPLFKKILSRLAGVSLYYLIGIPTHDVTNSFKLYGKKVLDNIQIKSTGGFELGMELVVKSYLKGFKIGEVPSCWQDRAFGQSNFKLWKWLPSYMYWYLFAVCNCLMGH